MEEMTVSHAKRRHAPRQRSRSAKLARKSGSIMDPKDPGRHAQEEWGAHVGGSPAAQGVIGKLDAYIVFFFSCKNPDFLLNLFSFLMKIKLIDLLDCYNRPIISQIHC